MFKKKQEKAFNCDFNFETTIQQKVILKRYLCVWKGSKAGMHTGFSHL